MKNIRLICCDIDGTLVRDDKSLSVENVKWIKKVTQEQNVKFVIVTGRMNYSILPYYEKLGLKSASSCLNGCVLYDEEGIVRADHRIECEQSIKLLSIIRKFEIELLSIERNTWYTETQSGYLYNNKLPIYRQDSLLCNFEELLSYKKMNKLLVMSKDSNKLIALEKAIVTAFKYDNCPTLYYGPNFLEIMPNGINKGIGIKDLKEYFGIDYSQIMAIGDDFNDIEMFKVAGIPVVMDNALDNVKTYASIITDTNENDGVSKIIQKMFF